MRTITITRKKEIFYPAAYYFVYCDGKPVLSVENGKSASFETDGNAHVLYFEVTRPIKHGRGGTAKSNILPLPAGEDPCALNAYRSLRVFHLEFAE